MATLVDTIADLGDDNFTRHSFAIPTGYIDVENGKDITKIVAFTPDKGNWTYKTIALAEGEECTDQTHIVIYWTERDGKVVVVPPTAGKHERDELVTEALERAGDAEEPSTKKAKLSSEGEDGDMDAAEKEDTGLIDLTQSQVIDE